MTTMMMSQPPRKGIKPKKHLNCIISYRAPVGCFTIFCLTQNHQQSTLAPGANLKRQIGDFLRDLRQIVHFLHKTPGVEDGICKSSCIVLQPWIVPQNCFSDHDPK